MGKPKLNIPMCAALVLLLLTIISIHLTSGLYARYTATGTASDSARVAKFDVKADVQPATDEDGNKMEDRFVLTVTNNSEVAVKYNVVIGFTDPMSIAISIAMDDDPAQTPAENESSVTFTNENWTLAPGSASSPHTLQFAVTDWTDITKSVSGAPTAEMSLNFTVSVTAEQID